MEDAELIRLCTELKRQVRGPMLSVCEAVLDRYAAKNLPPKPKRSRDMAKYMREWRAKRKPVPVSVPAMRAAVVEAMNMAPDKQAKLEALRKTLGGNLVEPKEPEEPDIDFG